MKKVLLLMLGLSLFIVGCDDDKDNNPVTSTENVTFNVTIENIGTGYMFSSSGVFNTPTTSSSPGPLLPGSKYEFEFDAAPGHKLSLATMFVHSNDFFYAPDEAGIDLFDNSGNPITGDITSQFMLWDAGTEFNQEPGLGADQAPSQSGSNIGAIDTDSNVRLATDTFTNLPVASDVLQVTVINENSTHFKLTIENVSSETTLSTSDGSMNAVPLAPGVWVVHTDSSPLFKTDQPNGGFGLEGLAEDGNPAILADYLQMHSGLIVPFAPGVWAVHNSTDKLFISGQSDDGSGLEALAEDGDPSILSAYINSTNGISSSSVFNTPVGSSSPGPLVPGGSYEFTFSAESDQRLSFVSMMVQSNDLFIGTSDAGLELFDTNDEPLTGEITNKIFLWDAGTEVNELPGIGLNQPLRQSGGNTGQTENGNIQMVNDSFTYPAVNQMVKVTISVQ
ncbi:MAG: hypothetical protein GY936_07310 [Ignavibacteriae bacterium]|nr:hypothetical protein [Ignavibacteriota bacterium]